MTKQTQRIFSVTKKGKPLDKKCYTWDETTRTFSTKEDGLVIDFSGIDNSTIKAGPGCTINAGPGCTIKAGSGCTIDADSECVVIRRDIFQVIQPEKGEVIKLCPQDIPGYISKREGEDAFYMDIDGERIEHIIADGIKKFNRVGRSCKRSPYLFSMRRRTLYQKRKRKARAGMRKNAWCLK